MEKQREPPSLVQLGGDQLLEQADPPALLTAALALATLPLRQRCRRTLALSQ